MSDCQILNFTLSFNLHYVKIILQIVIILKIVINFCPIVKLILRTVNLQRTMSIYFEVCQTKLQIVQNKLKKGVPFILLAMVHK